MDARLRLIFATLLIAYPKPLSREKLLRVIYGDSQDKYSNSGEFDTAMENLSDEIPWEVMSSKGCYYLALTSFSPVTMTETELELYEFVKRNPGMKSEDIAKAIGGAKNKKNIYGTLHRLKARLKEIGTERMANSYKGYRIVALNND